MPDLTSDTTQSVIDTNTTPDGLMVPPRGKLKDIADPEVRERERMRRELPRMKLRDIADPKAREQERTRRRIKYEKKRAKNSKAARYNKTAFNAQSPLDMESLQNKDAVKRGLINSIHRKSSDGERERKNFRLAHAILPEVFRLDSNVKPLAVGISRDVHSILCGQHGWTPSDVNKLLAKYTRSNWYLKSLINGVTPRVDINGKDAGYPTPDHIDTAAKMMSWKLARRAARRKMFPELYEQCYGSLSPR